MRRIFIAINLPENIKNKLASIRENWPDLPIRWTKKDNLHITVEFIGNVSDEDILKICQETKELAKKYNPFFINLTKVCYGPLNKPAKMIWIIGDKIEELNLSPHITLGRLKGKPLEQVFEEINLSFEANSIEVMESEIRKGGPRYTILESCPLKND